MSSADGQPHPAVMEALRSAKAPQLQPEPRGVTLVHAVRSHSPEAECIEAREQGFLSTWNHGLASPRETRG